MKRRSFFYSLAAGVVVLLLIGIGGYYWLISQSPLTLLRGGSSSTPAAVMFIPKQSPVMVSTLVNVDRLQSLWQWVARPQERRRSRWEFNQLKNSLLANTGLEYRQDIQPWLGEEITLAVTSLDLDRDQQNGRQPGYLMALATKDANKSNQFLQLLFSKRALTGTELAVEQYKGVKLIYDHQRSPESFDSQNSFSRQNSLAAAVVGDHFVLFANHPKVLRDAINNVQAPDLSLTSSSEYQQALSLLPSRRIGLVFLNLPAVTAWLGKPQTLTYATQVIALELNRQGLLAQTSLIAAPDQEMAPPIATVSQPVKALQYIPATAGLAISGSDLSNLKNTDLNQLWTQVSFGLSGSSDDAISRLFQQPLAALQARWGIDLPQDIFTWVQGEYALAMLPRAEPATADWIFVTQKSATAEQGIAHLDAIAQQQGLSITRIPLEKQQIAAWTELVTTLTNAAQSDNTSLTLKAKVHGVHATVGEYQILTTSVEAMDAALKASQVGALMDSPKFQTNINAIPQPNKGYVYLDWKATQEILERQLPVLRLLEVAGKPFFNNLRSLTISSYSSDPHVLKGGIFFQLH